MSSLLAYSNSMEAHDMYEKFDSHYDSPYEGWFYVGFVLPPAWIYIILRGGYELFRLYTVDISPHAPTAIGLRARKISCVGGWVTKAISGLVFYAVCGWSIYMMMHSRW
ncbi:hypothetical protein CJU90_4264 [Yarrowia sp. C11]|nr:hypothetical protein CJU90_4264 [Yarrowia sp. C11]